MTRSNPNRTPGPPSRPAPGARRLLGSRSDPLDGVARLIVDGSNLLHLLNRSGRAPGRAGERPDEPGTSGDRYRSGGRASVESDRSSSAAAGPWPERAAGSVGPAPAAALVGRLRGVIPPAIRIEIVLDGPPERGLHGTRIASGLTVRHSGRATADSLIERLVGDAIGTGGSAEAARIAGQAILVATDDAALAAAIRRRGGRTIGARWLVARLDRPRLNAPSSGLPRPPRTSAAIGQGRPDMQGDDDDRRGWRPGRGATRKTGNPMRGHRSS